MVNMALGIAPLSVTGEPSSIHARLGNKDI
jgi:hypothetical protein